MRVDLNADIGESVAVDGSAGDAALFRWITSGSVACGFHAGNPSTMRETVFLAARSGVAVGAHPSFHDLAGFGRHEVEMAPRAVADLVRYQVGALSAIVRAEGVKLQHVKPHGALYNMSARRADLADAIAQAVASFDDSLVLIGLPQSELLAAGSRAGLRIAAEGFADRAYEPDGSLTPRRLSDAVLTDPARVAERAVGMVRDGKVTARDGSMLSVRIDTICVHGDTPGAVEIAAAVRRALDENGVTVAPLTVG